MQWKPLLRDVGVSTGLALGVAAFFDYVDAAPLLLSLGVLLFSGPVTEVVLELIRSRNPHGGELVPAPRRIGWIFMGCVACMAALALAASRWWHIRYWTAFARGWLTIAGAGAVNAIVAEWEDNAPGGFLNPRQ